MGYEKRDWEVATVEECFSCKTGDHECAEDELGYACSCDDCRAKREDAAEFFNGLEDFFKSIDPSRVGWETIEAEVRENLPCPVCSHLLRSHGDGDGCAICGVWCGADEFSHKWEAFETSLDAGDLVS